LSRFGLRLRAVFVFFITQPFLAHKLTAHLVPVLRLDSTVNAGLSSGPTQGFHGGGSGRMELKRLILPIHAVFVFPITQPFSQIN
jgi:hypothetical protein